MLFRQWVVLGITAPFWQWCVALGCLLSAATLAAWGIRRAVRHNRAAELEAAAYDDLRGAHVQPEAAAPARPAVSYELYPAQPAQRGPADPRPAVLAAVDTGPGGPGAAMGAQGAQGDAKHDIRQSWGQYHRERIARLELELAAAREAQWEAFKGWLASDLLEEWQSVDRWDQWLAEGELARCDWISRPLGAAA